MQILTWLMMKKLNLIPGLLFVLVPLTITSCEKEKPLSEAIVGKWKVQSERQVFNYENVKKFEYTYYYETDDMAYEFTGGGSVIQYISGEAAGTTTFTLNGNTVIIETGDEDIEWEITIDGDTLTWVYAETKVIENMTYLVDYYFTATRSN